MKHYCILLLLLISVGSSAQETLPVIRLTGDFGYDYQEGIVSIIYPDGSSQEGLIAQIKWRGGSTNIDDKHKRNYKIKFDKDYSFFGLRNDDNWILDAGQADVFRLRNLIATELWNDFATKPYYIDKEPKALSGVRGKVVEVYLNDEYRGIYSFTENMDRKQMKLKKFDDEGNIHGTLWKSVGYGCATMNSVPESYNNKEPIMDVFEAKYPDLNDMDSTDYSTLWNAIDFVVNSDDHDFINHIEEYFDIPVIIDYYLFVNLLNAIDNEGKNMFWAVYDKMTNKKLTPAVWDLDISLGAKSVEQYNKKFSSPEYNSGDVLYLITRLKRLNVDNFNQKVKDRYSALRKTFFSVENLQNRYMNYFELLKSSGAADREEERWSKDTDVLGAEINFDAEIEYINNWIVNRINYLDKYHFNYDTNIQYLTYDHPDETIRIYNLQGQPFLLNQQLPKGIYIYRKKKIIKR